MASSLVVRRTLVLLGAWLFGPAACAHRIDAQSRAAFEKSSGRSSGDEANERVRSSESGDPGGDPDALPAKAGWERLNELVGESTSILEASPSPATVARLAQTWCDVEPEATQTDHGEVRACFPNPPLVVDGHRFTLELGAIGVIGLVATDLSERESRALTSRALSRTREVCIDSFTTGSSQREVEHEVHTCATAGGSLLAIGRLPVSRELWQVSIAVVGAN